MSCFSQWRVDVASLSGAMKYSQMSMYRFRVMERSMSGGSFLQAISNRTVCPLNHLPVEPLGLVNSFLLGLAAFSCGVVAHGDRQQ